MNPQPVSCEMQVRQCHCYQQAYLVGFASLTLSTFQSLYFNLTPFSVLQSSCSKFASLSLYLSQHFFLLTSVTSKSRQMSIKAAHKLFLLEKLKISTNLQKLPKNVSG